MAEAMFGLVGVVVGSLITWLQGLSMTNASLDRDARYLAVRVVCVLQKFLEDSVAVVKDDGLSYGQRTPDGSLEPQVASPGPPVFPDDVNWKSIEPEFMYEVLSFPSDVEAADNNISAVWNFACPPDYEEYFDARVALYGELGLHAYKLIEKLSKKYDIKRKTYDSWDPTIEIKRELAALRQRQQKQAELNTRLSNKIS